MAQVSSKKCGRDTYLGRRHGMKHTGISVSFLGDNNQAGSGFRTTFRPLRAAPNLATVFLASFAARGFSLVLVVSCLSACLPAWLSTN
jgi:hypothetical protein